MAIDLNYMEAQIAKVSEIAAEIQNIGIDARGAAMKNDVQELALVSNIYDAAGNLFGLAADMTSSYIHIAEGIKEPELTTPPE